mmetsp:Transcript_36406/g.76687  ORF Transcript_36406/g.76687 Transcript_36406/m.76687 type:complete len:106 (-) Transcript_36406:939-1256(-)
MATVSVGNGNVTIVGTDGEETGAEGAAGTDGIEGAEGAEGVTTGGRPSTPGSGNNPGSVLRVGPSVIGSIGILTYGAGLGGTGSLVGMAPPRSHDVGVHVVHNSE